jgi:hypothetical protein
MISAYTYTVTDRQTEMVYVGVRWRNQSLGITPEEDLGKKYLTSSKVVKNIAKTRPEDLLWKIDRLHETRQDAITREAELYHFLENRYGKDKMLNKVAPDIALMLNRSPNPNDLRTEEDWDRIIQQTKETRENWSESRKKQAQENLSKGCEERNRRHGERMWSSMIEKKDELYGRNASIEEMLMLKYGAEEGPIRVAEYIKNRAEGMSRVDKSSVSQKRTQTMREKNNGAYFSPESARSISESQKGINNSSWKGYVHTPEGIFTTAKEAREKLGISGNELRKRMKDSPDLYFYKKEK